MGSEQNTHDGWLAAKITNLQPWSQSVNPGTNGPPASTTSPRPLSFLRPLPPAAVPRLWLKRTPVCAEVDQAAASCTARGLSIISPLLHFDPILL